MRGASLLAVSLVVVVLGAGLAGAEVIIRPPDVKFKLSTHGTYIEFSDNATADRITVNAEDVVFESIKLEDSPHTTSSLAVSVENANMTIKALESENIEFELIASAGTKSLAEMTSGERGKPKRVKLNGVEIPWKESLPDLYAADNGWFYDGNTVYVGVTHGSMGEVFIDYTSNVTPEVLNAYVPPPVDPNSAFDVKVEVRDNDTIADIEEIYLKIYAEAKAEGDADSVRDHYTFKWARVGGWSEVGPDTGGSHIDTESCVAGDDAKTTDNFLFNIKLGVTASPNNSWNVWAKVIDSASEEDSEEFPAEFSVTDYLSLTIDDTALTFLGNPGETDKAASENPTVCTVDANVDFKIQVKLSGNWTGSAYGGSIPMANTHADNDGSSPWDLNMSGIYENLWSSVGYGEDVQRNIYWFLDFSLPLRDDVYQTTFHVNGVKS